MKIMMVVVLYEKKIQELPFYPLLDQLLAKGIRIICYDNSKEEQRIPFQHPFFEYHHDARNLGIATAYNYAFNQGKKDCEGLLLLDHDSDFTLDYIEKLQQLKFENKVAIIAPLVFANSKQISPLDAENYINHTFQALAPGIYNTPVTGINSGSLVAYSFLEKIDGFNEAFPLDFLDHWLFFQLHEQGKQLQVVDYRFNHDLSVLNYANVSHQRFESILKAETLFYTRYQKNFLKAHKIQLLKRTLKLFVKEKDRFFWKKTWKTFLSIVKM